jgi:AcrR family transcriptional regulator
MVKNGRISLNILHKMAKSKNASAWTEQGYKLCGEEGFGGLHVERLARILQLNKSGFYHYFGDMDVFFSEILMLHERKLNHLLQDVRQINNVDPEYLQLLVKHAPFITFQVQLTRLKNNRSFYQASEGIEQKINLAVQPLWSDFFGAWNNSDLALRYYFIIRDVFYTRINLQNLNYPFLHHLVMEAKHVITQLARHQVWYADSMLHTGR